MATEQQPVQFLFTCLPHPTTAIMAATVTGQPCALLIGITFLVPCRGGGRIELLVDDLVPRRGTRVVWCDDGDGSALCAARRMSGLGGRARQ